MHLVVRIKQIARARRGLDIEVTYSYLVDPGSLRRTHPFEVAAGFARDTRELGFRLRQRVAVDDARRRTRERDECAGVAATEPAQSSP